MAQQRIGILAHPARAATAHIADQIEAALRARGVDVWAYDQWSDREVCQHVEGTDIIVAIGGDGLMLRAARACAGNSVPLLGVNTGHLGFLTEISPEAFDACIDALLAKDYWVEKRMMVRAEAFRDDQPQPVAAADALNEAVITHGGNPGILHLLAYVDSEWTTTYNGDGLIIATPTGSTAYALASGGPILPPELRNILLVPLAPHLSLDRPIVLPEGATVDVIISRERETPAMLAIDGVKLCDLAPGDYVRVSASDNVSSFVRLRDRHYFYRSLLDRLEPRITQPPQMRRL